MFGGTYQWKLYRRTTAILFVILFFVAGPSYAAFSPLPTTGTMSGVVWHDANENGVFDGDEVGVPAVTVSLSSAGDVLSEYDVLTGVDGEYVLSDVPFGTYRVLFSGFPDDFFTLSGDTTYESGDLLLTFPTAAVEGIDLGLAQVVDTGGAISPPESDEPEEDPIEEDDTALAPDDEENVDSEEATTGISEDIDTIISDPTVEQPDDEEKEAQSTHEDAEAVDDTTTETADDEEDDVSEDSTASEVDDSEEKKATGTSKKDSSQKKDTSSSDADETEEDSEEKMGDDEDGSDVVAGETTVDTAEKNAQVLLTEEATVEELEPTGIPSFPIAVGFVCIGLCGMLVHKARQYS